MRAKGYTVKRTGSKELCMDPREGLKITADATVKVIQPIANTCSFIPSAVGMACAAVSAGTYAYQRNYGEAAVVVDGAAFSYLAGVKYGKPASLLASLSWWGLVRDPGPVEQR